MVRFSFRVTDGDGPEVYADILTKDLTPYVTTQVLTLSHMNKKPHFAPDWFCVRFFLIYTGFLFQVSSHAARRKIAEATSTPREFLKKYNELKSRNVRELDSLVYLLSCIIQDKPVRVLTFYNI